MDTVVSRASLWLAFAGAALAHDGGFAVHMGTVACAALVGLWWAVGTADYAGIAHGILRTPTDPSRYDDDPVRWGMIATVFWAVIGLLVGLLIALQLPIRYSTLSRGSTSGACGPCTPRA